MSRPKKAENKPQLSEDLAEFKSEEAKRDTAHAADPAPPADTTPEEVTKVETSEPAPAADATPEADEYVEVQLMPPTVTLCLSGFGFTFSHKDRPKLHKVRDKELIDELLAQRKFGIEVLVKDI